MNEPVNLQARNPSEGLKILEKLHSQNPYNQQIINRLINVYIRFGMNQQAMDMISKISDNSADVQTLTYKAWLANQQNDYDNEYKYWSIIFNKNFAFIPKEDRNYLMQQASTKQQKISVMRASWDTILQLAFASLPVGLQELLGKEIESVVLLANNPSINLPILKENIKSNSLIVYFNHNEFLEYNEEFNNNYSLWFFRKIISQRTKFIGLPSLSEKVINPQGRTVGNIEDFYLLNMKKSTFLMFNEHMPVKGYLRPDFFSKVSNPYYSSCISATNLFMNYYPQPEKDYIAESSITEPTSGFLLLKYLYYSQLHLKNLNKKSFNIKLIGFNFNSNTVYGRGEHNWDYERSQLENLPSGITRVVV